MLVLEFHEYELDRPPIFHIFIGLFVYKTNGDVVGYLFTSSLRYLVLYKTIVHTGSLKINLHGKKS